MDYLTDRAAIRLAPNKLKILRWSVDVNKIFLWNFPNRRLLEQNFWFQRHSDRPFCNAFDALHFIKHKPSIRERAWFMGFFNAGGYIFSKHWYLLVNPVFELNTDRGVFVNYDPIMVYFFCKNSKIVTQKTRSFNF